MPDSDDKRRRAPRSDIGRRRLRDSDLPLLRIIAEQYVVAISTLAMLRGSGIDAARAWARRMVALGYARLLDRLHLAVSPEGMRLLGLPYDPSGTRQVAHAAAVAKVRLWLQGREKMLKQQDDWLSERRMRYQRTRDGISDGHPEDGVFRGKIAIEIELSRKAKSITRAIIIELLQRYEEVYYVGSPETVGLLRNIQQEMARADSTMLKRFHILQLTDVDADLRKRYEKPQASRMSKAGLTSNAPGIAVTSETDSLLEIIGDLVRRGHTLQAISTLNIAIARIVRGADRRRFAALQLSLAISLNNPNLVETAVSQLIDVAQLEPDAASRLRSLPPTALVMVSRSWDLTDDNGAIVLPPANLRERDLKLAMQVAEISYSRQQYAVGLRNYGLYLESVRRYAQARDIYGRYQEMSGSRHYDICVAQARVAEAMGDVTSAIYFYVVRLSAAIDRLQATLFSAVASQIVLSAQTPRGYLSLFEFVQRPEGIPERLARQALQFVDARGIVAPPLPPSGHDDLATPVTLLPIEEVSFLKREDVREAIRLISMVAQSGWLDVEAFRSAQQAHLAERHPISASHEVPLETELRQSELLLITTSDQIDVKAEQESTIDATADQIHPHTNHTHAGLTAQIETINTGFSKDGGPIQDDPADSVLGTDDHALSKSVRRRALDRALRIALRHGAKQQRGAIALLLVALAVARDDADVKRLMRVPIERIRLRLRDRVLERLATLPENLQAEIDLLLAECLRPGPDEL